MYNSISSLHGVSYQAMHKDIMAKLMWQWRSQDIRHAITVDYLPTTAVVT